MPQPLDASPKGSTSPSVGADDNVHNVFIKDILSEDSSFDSNVILPSRGDTSIGDQTKNINLDLGTNRREVEEALAVLRERVALATLPPQFPAAALFGFAATADGVKPAGTVDGSRRSADGVPDTSDPIRAAMQAYKGSEPKVVSFLDADSKFKPVEQKEVAPAPRPASVAGVDGTTTYEATESGAWQIKDKAGKVSSEHADFPGVQIKNVEAEPDGSVKLTLENGKIVRESKEGGRAHFPDEAAFKANHPNELVGRLKNIVWQGDDVKSFTSNSTGKNWYQIAKDSWAENPNATLGWNGHIEVDGQKGVFARTYNDGPTKGLRTETRTNGITESYKPDGSMDLEVPFSGDRKFTFKFNERFEPGKNVLTQPQELRIAEKDGSETIWTKIGPQEYQSNLGTKWKTDIQVKKDGTYSYKDLDNGERVVRTIDGRYEEERPADKTLIVKESGQLTRVKIGDNDIQIDYAADGSTSEIRHINKNLKLTAAADGTFTDSPIEIGKPYTKPEKFEIDVYTHPHLEADQKVRLLENVGTFRGMTKFSDAEKTKVFTEADRLLHGRKDSVMSAKEKASYADQLFWHIVNHTRNEQGSNGTCSVTALRGIALKERPSLVAKVTADLANDGQLTVLDGSVIKPKLDSMRVRTGSPEATFPPKSPNRSALGKMWDVAMCNVSLQRDTKDAFGTTVPKGSLSFEETTPTGRSDSGARTVRKDSNGNEYVLNKQKNGTYTPYDSPRVGFPSRIADIWHQVSGEKLTDRFLVHNNRWLDDAAKFKNLVGEPQKSEQEVEAVLLKNDLPKVVQANTGILDQRFRQQQALNEGKDPNTVARPAGGEHLFLVTGYDAATKTVTIDNSWSAGYDVPNKAQAAAEGKDASKMIFISLSDLYTAMSTTTNGDGSTLAWVSR